MLGAASVETDGVLRFGVLRFLGSAGVFPDVVGSSSWIRSGEIGPCLVGGASVLLLFGTLVSAAYVGLSGTWFSVMVAKVSCAVEEGPSLFLGSSGHPDS